jgi:hypothetical protein
MFYICSTLQVGFVMNAISGATWFRLSAAGDGAGTRCDETGAFVGAQPIVVHVPNDHGCESWRARPVAELNEALSRAYDLPVDMSPRVGALATIAAALNSGNLARAQVAALQLRLPNLPVVAQGRYPEEDKFKLACLLWQSGVLGTAAYIQLYRRIDKRDVSNQPRVPAGQPGGGQWTTDGGDETPQPAIVPAQTIPLPWGPFIRPMPGVRPLPPGAIRPLPPDFMPPLDIPGSVPREGIPQNPYPDRPECAEEWDAAYSYCKKLKDRGLLGQGDYRGSGKNMWQCMMGQVSQDCGGRAYRT